MNEQRRSAPSQGGSNPFSTRYIRPGSLDYLFPAEGSIPGLIERLADCGWRAEIVGPHGSGKSTLLRALIPELTALNIHVTLFILRQGARGLPNLDSDDVEWFPPDGGAASQASDVVTKLWMVDGAERLSALQRWRLRGICWWNRRGLLLTTHQPLGLPLLIQTSTSPALAWRLVTKLLPPDQHAILQSDVEQAFRQQHGNMREMLLSLFDVYQQRSAWDDTLQ